MAGKYLHACRLVSIVFTLTVTGLFEHTSKMASLLSSACLSVLLLVCAGTVTQASPAAEWLQTLTIVVGSFTNDFQVMEQIENYGRKFDEPIPFKYQPIDNPDLNEYNPMLFDELDPDVLERQCLVLSRPGEEEGEYISVYYNVSGIAKYVSGELKLSEITLDDITEEPLCTSRFTRSEDLVTNQFHCVTDTLGDKVAYTLNQRCKSTVVVLGGHTPEQNTGIPYIYYKTYQYPLPASWLEGVDDYVNPCAED